MAIIEKKVWSEYFDLLVSGKKKYDFRLNDFEVKEGDTILFKEWDRHKKEYTGRLITKKVTYVGRWELNDMFFPQEEIEKHGIQIMSLE